MYPVFSLLRRLATHHIYATESMLTDTEAGRHICLDKPTSRLDMEKAKWDEPSDMVAFSELVSVAKSSAEAAIALSKGENVVADLIRAHDLIYTMVVGPEEEATLEDGRVRRVSRYVVIRGVYRASSSPVLVQQQAKAAKKVRFRKSPKGTVRL